MPDLEISTQILIQAPPDRVWSVLTDMADYGQWNPFITAISGHVKRGGHLSVTVHPPSARPMHFKPLVLVVSPPGELRWRGTFLMGSLFAGEHYFQLQPQNCRATLFTHGERFSGLLAKKILRKLEGPTRLGFKAMNEALKVRAEGG